MTKDPKVTSPATEPKATKTQSQNPISEFDWKRISIVLTLMIGVSSLIAAVVTGGMGFVINNSYRDQVSQLDMTNMACELRAIGKDSTLTACAFALDVATQTLAAPTSTPRVITATPETSARVPIPSPTQTDIDAAMQNIVESAFAEAASHLLIGQGQSLRYPPGSWGQPAHTAMTSFWDSLSRSFIINDASWIWTPIQDAHPVEAFRFSGDSHSMWADACLRFEGSIFCGEADKPEAFETDYCLDRFNVIVSAEVEGQWYIATWTSSYNLAPLIEAVKTDTCTK